MHALDIGCTDIVHRQQTAPANEAPVSFELITAPQDLSRISTEVEKYIQSGSGSNSTAASRFRITKSQIVYSPHVLIDRFADDERHEEVQSCIDALREHADSVELYTDYQVD